jgi:5'-nucleotidase
VSIEDSTIGGPLSVAGTTGTPALVSANRIAGPLSCAANDPAPVDNELPNTADGGRDGQCRAL